jgi:hypothetical protein
MPKLLQATIAAAVLMLFSGCCRDTIREMASLKDGPERPRYERSAKAAPERDSRFAEVDDDDDDDKREIETGSVAKPDCQGAHLAYQATKEYLKNFGPRPPDQPGEKGPCKP